MSETDDPERKWTEGIDPALTDDQWREARSLPPGVAWGFGQSTEGTASRHAVAAICLYGTPEGFTREDVALLRSVALWSADAADGVGLEHLAERIEALLPPA